jgi:hypothetical protein
VLAAARSIECKEHSLCTVRFNLINRTTAGEGTTSLEIHTTSIGSAVYITDLVGDYPGNRIRTFTGLAPERVNNCERAGTSAAKRGKCP